MVVPTRLIVELNNINYVWHDFVSKNNHNALTLLALWAPVVMIYFLDVQVWYTVTSALLGGLEGAKDRLGEVGPQSKPIHSMISYKLKQNLIILHWQTYIIDSDSNFAFTKFQCCLEENFCWLCHETREE
jgi:hypothetical protein